MSPGRTGAALDAEERAKLDARIVRLLKQHRRVSHQQLLLLLQQQTADPPQPRWLDQHQPYQPCPLEAVKACIEGLISKEYVTRDESDRYVQMHLLQLQVRAVVLLVTAARLLRPLCSAETSIVISPERLHGSSAPHAPLLTVSYTSGSCGASRRPAAGKSSWYGRQHTA